MGILWGFGGALERVDRSIDRSFRGAGFGLGPFDRSIVWAGWSEGAGSAYTRTKHGLTPHPHAHIHKNEQKNVLDFLKMVEAQAREHSEAGRNLVRVCVFGMGRALPCLFLWRDVCVCV